MTTNRVFINSLGPGVSVDQTFYVKDKELRRNPAGSYYVACILSDKTGDIHGRWWKAGEAEFERLPKNGIIRVKARIEQHRGQPQLVVETLEQVEATPEEMSDLIPSSSNDPTLMWNELEGYLKEIQSPHLERFVQAFLEDEELIRKFKIAPAAVNIHHDYIGGLLEHTLSVVRAARALIPVYKEMINEDLLILGAFLHDIGKIEEFYTDGTIAYTDRGNLVGHMTSGTIVIHEKARQIAEKTGEAVPDHVIDVLQHLVLSHHGTKEKGSPKSPMMTEALILHALDDLDAKLNVVSKALDKDRGSKMSFTPYHRLLEVKIYKKPIPE